MKPAVWSESELELLRLHHKVDWSQLESLLGRTKSAIQRKINLLGLQRSNQKEWTAKEVKLLNEVFSSASKKDLVRLFDRSYESIFLKGRSLGLRRDASKWTPADDDFLKDSLDKMSIADIAGVLGRTPKSVTHRVYALGLSLKNNKWTDQELEVLQSQNSKKVSEIEGLNRSKVAIAQVLRTYKGTARRILKTPISSTDFAYCLGVICSDASVRSAGVELIVATSDSRFADVFADKMQSIFGITPMRAIKTGRWEYKGEVFYGEYYRVGLYSVDFLPYFATEDGVLSGNVRGSNGEWITFINNKFSWVWDEEFFWYFIGGLFDGDGHFREYHVSIGVKPKASQEYLVQMLNKYNIQTTIDSTSVYVSGKKSQKVFMGSIKSNLDRKSNIQQVDGVVKVLRADALQFYGQYHYLKNYPGNCISYGYLKDSKLIGMCSVSSVFKDSWNLKCVELQRFALSDSTNIYASQVISAFISRIKVDFVDVDLIRTFADPAQNHVGIIYQASNALYLGQTTPSSVFAAPGGKQYSGRYAYKSMQKDGVSRSVCEVSSTPGKHKYVFILTDAARKVYEPFALQYPKFFKNTVQ